MRVFGREFFGGQKKIDLPSNIELEHNTKQSFHWHKKEYDLTNPWIENYNGKYINFGQDNLYPNLLNDLYNRSSLHSAIVEFKKQSIIGNGFTIDDAGLEASGKLELAQFLNFVNGKDSLEELLEQVVMDYLIHGTVYIKLYWNSDKSKLLRIERIEPSKLRIGVDKTDVEDINRYYYNFDWNNYGQYKTTEYPAFDIKSDNKVEIIRFINDNPTVNWYTLPDYSSGTNWMHLDAEVSDYHKSNIENSINPSMALKFYKLPANEEEKRGILNNIKRNFQGASNTGRAMVFFADGKETAPDIEPIQVSNIDKQFSITADQIQRNICYAHRINPMIMGLKTPGSLGNSTELDVSFEIFNKTVIQPAQRDIEAIIKKILTLKKLPVQIKLNEVELYTKKQD